MGKYSYRCVHCGEEIKEGETLVSLAQFVLDGATEITIGRNPLYITRTELEQLILRTETVAWSHEPLNYITIEELCQFAYSKVNRDHLFGPAKNAEEAYQKYLETYQRAKDKLSSVAIEEELQGKKEKSAFSFFGVEDEEDWKEKSEWDSVRIPGFNCEQTIQLCNNFPDGKCYCRLRMEQEYGYSYQRVNESIKWNIGITENCYCPHCKKEILEHAFQKKQILIGMVGADNMGKRCLMFSLCSQLINDGGIVAITDSYSRKNFFDEFNSYRCGYKLQKTDFILGGTNVCRPSILVGDVIWTFIDIAGETIKGWNDGGEWQFEDQWHYDGKFPAEALLRNCKFAAVLKCDIYIMCIDRKWLEDPVERVLVSDIFQQFLNFAASRGQNARTFPALLAVTKVDEPIEYQEQDGLIDAPYDINWYAYREEYDMLRQISTDKVANNLTSLCYLTPVSCSAFGFKPYDYDYQWDPEDPTKPLKLRGGEVYRRPMPRNVDLIIDWIKKITGQAPNVVYEDGSTATVQLDFDRSKGHWNDEQCLAIAQLFCNPSEWDKRWLATWGDNALIKIKERWKIKRDFAKQEKEE